MTDEPDGRKAPTALIDITHAFGLTYWKTTASQKLIGEAACACAVALALVAILTAR